MQPRHSLAIFGYGSLIAAPLAYLSGFLLLDEFILVESLFLLNLALGVYMAWKMHKPTRAPDIFKSDYYLRDLDLRENPLFGACLSLSFISGVPIALLFDVFVTVYPVALLVNSDAAAFIHDRFIGSAIIIAALLLLSFISLLSSFITSRK